MEAKLKKTQFLYELKEELKKVSWTTKAELLLCTKMVVGGMFIFGLGIYMVDLVIKGALESFAHLVRFLF